MVYENKRILVTGGAAGIGREISHSFASLGAKVIIADNDYIGENLARSLCTLRQKQCEFFHVNLALANTCEELMRTIFEKFDDLDIIINNAAACDFAPLTEETTENWDYILATNLRAPFIIARDFIKNRRKKGYKENYGRIINIADTRFLMSEEGTEAYTASKGGLVSLTHALAVSSSAYNITVNAISPGKIHFGDEEVSYSEHRQHPSGRVGTPADVVKACLYLCDEQNNFINGQNIVLDGGISKKMIYID